MYIPEFFCPEKDLVKERPRNSRSTIEITKKIHLISSKIKYPFIKFGGDICEKKDASKNIYST
jgi:hypothetical protein